MSPVSVSHRLLRNGVLNLPRASPASKPLTEALLLRDAQDHHCQFNQAGFHNHLSHHILAAYDLGASPGLLQKIYDEEARIQRPIILEEKDKEMKITEDNWTQYLGNENAYNGFVTFFEHQIASLGVVKTLETFIFSSSANERGKVMLARLMSGVLHPFIQVGHGLEFGNDALVSTGLAMTAIHTSISPELSDFEATNSTTPREFTGLSVLEILELVYKSPTLAPPLPYDPNVFVNARIKAALEDGKSEEIRDLCSKFLVDENLGNTEMMSKIEEYVWASVLLMFATGKSGRKPRLDFFLMHLVTASLFLRSYVHVLENPAHKATIIKAFLPHILLVTLARGRPIIKPHLLMEVTDKPRPPYASGSPYARSEHSIGSPLNDDQYNPWSSLIEASLYSTDSHLLKTMRALVLAAREYGDTPPGSVTGAFKEHSATVSKEETHPGIADVDGSIFVRAAGMLMDYMGWTSYGQPEREDWDRSALGWDEAWNNED
ncbi:hypothetical protein F5876DRAFT_33900 [Lentinula aff. lateritia]|uniref:Uncharacterized protein n=1 Tax=Lentinula aff. lateritia TaxID=2804960 RepID=A0ACC1UBF4_9AGAR|nr:hypothetical protein F5876DRAFT_33900 [Lentinula aff. lateritia]